MLKASRLHGDVDEELCEMFTQRVAEIATLRRLADVLTDTDENEIIEKDGKRSKRDKVQIETILKLKSEIKSLSTTLDPQKRMHRMELEN